MNGAPSEQVVGRIVNIAKYNAYLTDLTKQSRNADYVMNESVTPRYQCLITFSPIFFHHLRGLPLDYDILLYAYSDKWSN